VSEVWTVGRLLEWTAPFFAQKGIEQPRLDAEVLLAHTLGVPRLQLYTGYDRPLEPEELAAFRSLVKRRATHEPIAYITGSRGFHEIELKTDKRALVPRPETELLVELALKALPKNARVLDIGTGTGAIALSLLHERDDLALVATDISLDALSLARENAHALGLSSRIEFRHGSLFTPVHGEVFDALVSNPPYVETTSELERDVSEFEPHAALFAGKDGLSILRALLAEAKPFLKEGSPLFFEHGKGQSPALCEIARSLGYDDVRAERDLDGNERVLCARR
jgi:release factor glutamine methyltransferase